MSDSSKTRALSRRTVVATLAETGGCGEMRKLVVCNAMSLDGYYAGLENNVMVLELDGAFDAYNAERLRAADVLLLGRSSFEGFKGFWPPIADDPDPRFTDTQREVSRLDNEIDKVVVSDSLTPEQTDSWHNTRIIKRADAHEQIAELKRDGDKDILVFGSRTLWSDSLAHGLVDELHLMVGPVVAGGGTPTFDRGKALASAHRAGDPPIEARRLLRQNEARTWDNSGNVLLRYAVSTQEGEP
jgi:dihydrofolate reductase